jgi:hypothetical protein
MDQLNYPLARRAAATFSSKKQMKVEGTITGCMTLVALFVTLRVYRRLFATRNWGLDDCEPASHFPFSTCRACPSMSAQLLHRSVSCRYCCRESNVNLLLLFARLTLAGDR